MMKTKKMLKIMKQENAENGSEILKLKKKKKKFVTDRYLHMKSMLSFPIKLHNFACIEINHLLIVKQNLLKK